MLLENKVALLVGASGSSGYGIAMGLARAGADVVMCDLKRTARADRVVADIQALGRRALFLPGDAANPEQAKSVVRQALAEFRSIDILVNHTVIGASGPFLQLSKEEWDLLARTNLRSVFVSCQAMLPHMLERGSGGIINVVSQDALVGKALHVAYCTTREGVVAFTKALALEVGRKGVRANVVAPGPKPRGHSKTPSGKLGPNALGRYATPEEIASSVVFLASDRSSLFYGQVLCPAGGD